MFHSNSLPEELSQHFVPMGVKITKVWWPKHASPIFWRDPHFEGFYKGIRIRFAMPDTEIDPYNCELRTYHPITLNVGLTLVRLPGRWKRLLSQPVRKSLFARKIPLWDKDLRCWAVHRAKARVLLEQGRVREAIGEVLEAIKEYAEPFLIIDDKKISLKFSDTLPSQGVLNALCQLNTLLAQGITVLGS